MEITYKEKDFSDRLVAFIDILGFTKLIQQDKTSCLRSINLINGILSHVLNVLKEDRGTVLSTKLFSDCICVSCKNTKENLFSILYELAFIQFYFSTEGIFLRGALSSGNHFENKRMIFSQGLVKAYEMEQSAIYPRIIVNKELINQIQTDYNSYFPIYVEFKKTELIIKSPDGHFFIDYLNLLHEEGMEHEDVLLTHKKSILKNIHQNIDDFHILEKFRWLVEYHNFKCNEVFNPSDYEDYAEIIKGISIDSRSTFPQFLKHT